MSPAPAPLQDSHANSLTRNTPQHTQGTKGPEMTQQPYGFQPQMPQQAPQQFQQFAPQTQAPQQFAQQAPQQFPPQQFQPQQAPQQFAQQAPQQFGYAPQAAFTPPAPQQGTLEAFNAQPVGGRPESWTWKGVPDGTTLVGTVTQDVGDRDVQQDVDPATKMPQTYRDQRPKYHMAVTLQLDPGTYNEQVHPGGAATLYVRGRLWDALANAMAAAGIPPKTAPKAGDRLTVTLVERRQGKGTIPANHYAAQYVAANGVAPAAQHQPPAPAQQAPQVQQAPVQQAPVQQVQAPVQQVQAPQVQQFQQAPVQQAPVQQAPVQQAPGGAVMSPEQQALLQRITGQV